MQENQLFDSEESIPFVLAYMPQLLLSVATIIIGFYK